MRVRVRVRMLACLRDEGIRVHAPEHPEASPESPSCTRQSSVCVDVYYFSTSEG